MLIRGKTPIIGNPMYDGNTCLHIASKDYIASLDTLLQMLVDHGPNCLEIKNNKGYTASSRGISAS